MFRVHVCLYYLYLFYTRNIVIRNGVCTKKNPSYIVSKIFKHHNKFTGTFKVKAGLAQMAKGGIIIDVTTSQEARIAEEAGVMSRDHEYIVYHISIF